MKEKTRQGKRVAMAQKHEAQDSTTSTRNDYGDARRRSPRPQCDAATNREELPGSETEDDSRRVNSES
jgi:hypothetical protein